MAAVDGSCQMPVAAYGIREKGELWLRAMLAAPDGTNAVFREARSPWPATAEANRLRVELGRQPEGRVAERPRPARPGSGTRAAETPVALFRLAFGRREPSSRPVAPPGRCRDRRRRGDPRRLSQDALRCPGGRAEGQGGLPWSRTGTRRVAGARIPRRRARHRGRRGSAREPCPGVPCSSATAPSAELAARCARRRGRRLLRPTPPPRALAWQSTASRRGAPMRPPAGDLRARREALLAPRTPSSRSRRRSRSIASPGPVVPRPRARRRGGRRIVDLDAKRGPRRVVLSIASGPVRSELAARGIEPVTTRLFADHSVPRCPLSAPARGLWLTTPKCATKLGCERTGARRSSWSGSAFSSRRFCRALSRAVSPEQPHG
jgi:hypothetical protein